MAITGQIVDKKSIQRSRSQLPIIEHYPLGFSVQSTSGVLESQEAMSSQVEVEQIYH